MKRCKILGMDGSHFWAILMLSFITTSDRIVLAAPDDIEEAPNQEVRNRGEFAVMNINVDQQIFQPQGNEAAARTQINNMLKLRMLEIGTVCQLTEEQKQKLMLAASGDIHRFFSAVDAVRQLSDEAKNDQHFWRHIGPLQMKMSAGLFNNDSLFAKTLDTALSPEQLAKYKVVTDERRAFTLKAQSEQAVLTLEQSLPLRADQRERLIKLMIEEHASKPEQQGFQLLYEIFRIPEKKLRAIFDDTQWKLIEPQVRQFNPKLNIFNILPFR